MIKYTVFAFLFFLSKIEAICFPLPDFYPIPGLYVEAIGGFSGGYKLKCNKLETNLGYFIGAKVGKEFSDSLLRFEEELIWQRNTVHKSNNPNNQNDQTDIMHANDTHVRGCVNIWSLMTNALIDLNCQFPVRPFIGGGLGYAYAKGHWTKKMKTHNDYFFINKGSTKSYFDRSGFAWQIILGLKYFACLGFEVNLEYHYLNIEHHLSNHNLGLNLVKVF